MKRKKGFTLIELLVVISIIALLLSILMPGLSKAKAQAKKVVCGSNLKQWGLIFSTYLTEYDKFPSGSHLPDGSYDEKGPGNWTNAMAGYYPDGYDLFCCPVANRPGVDSSGSPTGVKVNQSAWGKLPDSDWFIEGMYGSYGFNWYAYSAAPNMKIDRYDTRNNWGRSISKSLNNIPLFFDASWVNIGPFETDLPPEFEGQMPDVWPGDEMRRVCLNRHSMAINSLFMDMSMRKVDLKQLWELQWHKNFDTGNATIRADSWPDWMK